MFGLTDLIERLRLLLFRRREERELDEELRFHLEMEADQQRRQGVDANEAARRGRIALGGVEQVKEDVRDARGTRWLEDGLRDIRHAVRTLIRARGFTIVSVATLAVGIGGTTAVFSAVDAVLLEPLPYEQPGQLVRLYQYYVGDQDKTFVTPVHFLAYRERLGSFEGVAAINTYHETGADIGGSDRPERIRLLKASADYFEVIRIRPALGRGFQRDEEAGAAVVILSDALWRREFRDQASALGRPFLMNGEPYTVIGVMPPGFADPIAGRIDALVPQDLTEGKDPQNAGNHYLTVIGRLRPGAPISRAQAELDGLDLALEKEFRNAKNIRARLYPLQEDIVGPASRSLEIMLGAVALVLVLVCVNIANLLLVRGSDRAREFALRAALGAPRERLVKQLLIESVLLALAGDLAGLGLARLLMPAIVALGEGSIPRLTALSLEPRLLVFSVGIASLSAIFFGLAPALRSTRQKPTEVLRDQTRSATASAAQGRLRGSLVVSQVALAFVLLAGAGLLLASFAKLRDVPLGIKPDGVLTFELALPEARYDSTRRARFYEEFASQAGQLPGVRAVGGISKLPATGIYNTWDASAMTGPLAGTKQAEAMAEQRIVSGDYFRAAGIVVLSGRVFDGRDVAGVPDRVVVSKSLADRIFPNTDPIGQRLRAGGRQKEVIGVVADVAVDAEGTIAPYVYHAHTQFAGDRNWELAQVVATAGMPETVEPAIRRVIANLDPELVMYRPTTLDAAIGHGTATRLFTLRLLSAFASVALLLAALGLFGILSYTVKLRSREFGIRMALGAESRRIRAMVLRSAFRVTAGGLVIGLLGAIILAKVMRSLLFQVSPLEPRVLTGAVLFVLGIAAAAAYLPAFRATRVDPRQVLQGE